MCVSVSLSFPVYECVGFCFCECLFGSTGLCQSVLDVSVIACAYVSFWDCDLESVSVSLAMCLCLQVYPILCLSGSASELKAISRLHAVCHVTV